MRSHRAGATTFTIDNVRVFDGDGLSELRAVHAKEGLFVDEPATEVVIDGEGMTLLPGLIDAHIHLTGLADLELMARWGVTTAFDMGSYPPQLVDTLRARPGLTDIRSSGSPASGPGGAQTTLNGFPPSTALTGPDQAERFVRDRVAERSDFIKIIVEDPEDVGDVALGIDTLAALAAAAHARDLRVVAHAPTLAGYRRSINAGVNVLTHAPIDGPTGPDLVADIADRGIIAVPTLVMMRGVVRLHNRQVPESCAYHFTEDAVKAMRDAGIPIVVGTDSNDAPGAPFNVEHGVAVHDELSLLVAAGLTPVEALRAATVVPAALFDLTDRGAILPGLRADAFLVEGDPTHDISDTMNIRGVWGAGYRIR
ncbi:amidohydrolase family protein [Klugiella xanthotipulae]|uniref:Imidazolonepropionase-like amidohydrolase n=1 Tax=Klugiella xanthotipulae TaxID=244735 RepID=A0A543HXH4_9MICO|nr:amidohydrolase family protein [Klugiella xanthotipulae]TQM63064.1 imidazolonepropionase-like amidohydrolase [Klugiella xanthotipulae]